MHRDTNRFADCLSDLCLVEKPVFLDTKFGPSMTDLMGYACNAKGDAVVLEPRPTRARRLEFLSKHLSRTISSDSPIRYQLLHRTVSAVLEAQLHGAAAAVVLVQSFGPDTAANFSDFSEFLNELGGGTGATKRVVSGPYQLGEQRDMPTYFLWWQQDE